jgi:hypothetical protein
MLPACIGKRPRDQKPDVGILGFKDFNAYNGGRVMDVVAILIL